MFFIFLVLSTFMWTLSKLSKEYTHIVKVKTNYINFSNDKVLHNIPVKELDIVLKATGFNLLSYNAFREELNIDIAKVQQIKDKYFFLTNANLSKLQSQFNIDETLIRVYPDSIFFDFGKLSTKKIKVTPNIKIDYKSGYNLVGDIEIMPKFIILNGTEKQLKEINKITTIPFTKHKLTADFEFSIALDIPTDYDNINFSTKLITIKGVVEKFTEASLIVPFTLLNVPKSLKIKTFQENIEITYKVSLANYDKIKPTDFKVICNYDKVNNSENSFLFPELLKQSNLVSNVKITPEKIFYLIQK